MTRPGRIQQTPCGLSSWADGRGMWVNRVTVVMIPVRPETLTTPTRVTQHQTPNGSTTDATWAIIKNNVQFKQIKKSQHISLKHRNYENMKKIYV